MPPGGWWRIAATGLFGERVQSQGAASDAQMLSSTQTSAANASSMARDATIVASGHGTFGKDTKRTRAPW